MPRGDDHMALKTTGLEATNCLSESVPTVCDVKAHIEALFVIHGCWFTRQ